MKSYEEEAEKYWWNLPDHNLHSHTLKNRVTQAFLAGCEHAYAIDKWISVADALPEKDSFAVCYYGGIAPIVGCYKGKGMWLCDEDNEMWVAGEEITHWMPIPEPPKPRQLTS